MKKWLSDTPLQKKMLYSYGILFVVSLIAFVIFFVRSFRQDMQSEINHMKQSNGQLELNLNDIFESMESFFFFHYSDDRLRTLISSNDRDISPQMYASLEELMHEKLNVLATTEPYVLRATLLTSDGRIYKNLDEDQTDYQDRMKKIADHMEWEKDDKPYVCEPRKERINLVNYRVISLIFPMWDVYGMEPIGYMFLDLDYDKLKSQWKQTETIGLTSDFMILSRNQVLFDSSSEDKLNKETDLVRLRQTEQQENFIRVHGKKCITVLQKYGYGGWTLVQYIPVNFFIGRILGNMWVLLFIFAAVVFVTILGSYGFSRQVSYPVRILSEEMSRVAVDTDEEQEIPLFSHDEVEKKDEVGKMIQSYNAMARRINDNIIRTYQYKLQQKRTELKMLQFQINPHFLYNALNTITAIAKLENVDYIPEISTNLSDMFRYNIKGDDIVTWKEELDHTMRYMHIQMIRFPERFVVENHVDEQVLQCKTLKFLLQPVVENCYKYGFAKRKSRDCILIGGYLDENQDIIMTVEDNGTGIEREKLKQLNDSLKCGNELEDSGGIGLHNVNSRLKEYFGDAYGLTIESEEGSYTRVIVKAGKIPDDEESVRLPGEENDE